MNNIELIDFFKNYYKDTKIPTSIAEYINNYPKGYSRTMLRSKYGLTVVQLLEMLNVREPKISLVDRISNSANRFKNITLIKTHGTTVKTCTITIKCNNCNYEDTCSLVSYELRKYGCRNNNVPIDKTFKLLDRLDELNLYLDQDLVNIRIKSKIKVACCFCDISYYAIVSKLLHPGSDNEYKCPNCTEKHSKIIQDNIKFDSQFERDCYKLLISKYPHLLCKVKYKQLGICDKNWVADFVLNNIIIEVTNFKRDNIKNSKYFNNLDQKIEWCRISGIKIIVIEKLSEIEKI